jgi:hypothetical protein
VIGIINTASGFNPCHGRVDCLLSFQRFRSMKASRIRPRCICVI